MIVAAFAYEFYIINVTLLWDIDSLIYSLFCSIIVAAFVYEIHIINVTLLWDIGSLIYSFLSYNSCCIGI